MNEGKKLEKILNNYGLKTTKQAKKILLSKNKVASGNLIKKLQIKVEKSDKGFSLLIIAPPYAKYVDLGVKGKKSSKKAPNSPYQYTNKMPPAGPIDRWMIKKGIKNIRDKKGRFIKRKQLQYAIRKSIFLYGLETTNFTKPYYDNLGKLNKELGEQISQDLANTITEKLSNIQINL